jgi:2-amino-4-hydroxy-6-hydroxymethyldihydropteridine diphosphokinase
MNRAADFFTGSDDLGAWGVPVFVALGSNIEPAVNLPRAARHLAERFPGLTASRIYETAAVGPSTGPTFLNAAVRFVTALAPARLKHEVLRPLEAELGRVRTADRNAPRTIDLDIALYGGLILHDPVTGLDVPDADTLIRAHLALPLADLEPDRVHPLDGRTLGAIAADFADEPGVRVIGGPEALLGPG